LEKRILDEATRTSLRGYVPFSVNATMEVSLNDLLPENSKLKVDENFIPVFSVRPFTQAEVIQLRKNIGSLPTNPNPTQYDMIVEQNMKLIRACIMNWRNVFDDGSGEEIQYRADPSGGCDQTLFKMLPEYISIGLMGVIRRISGLSSVEALGLK
jgi:hypothetical protein